MGLVIEQVSESCGVYWLVYAYGLTFRFPDQPSAEHFAAILEERVNAPHELPAAAIKHWAAEHYRMLRGS